MKVALVHYHLQPGGVTRVIENTVQAWKKNGLCPDQWVVLSGRPYAGGSLENVRVVEGLDYANALDSPDPKILRERMEEIARSALGGLPDLWHIHNHSLGKNPGLSGAVAELARSGARMLLQPHDFAEDGRPQNFCNLGGSTDLIYPIAPQIHYAVLNRRDQHFLQSTVGGLASPVHLLANAIAQPPDLRQSKPGNHLSEIPENLFLYPVRAVRRKNLGELALLAGTHPEFHFANSLGPTNPSFQPVYQSWIEFARENRLGLTFGLNEQTDATFAELVNHAQSIINVSVAEGFGLGFLEPWTFGKSLCGRNITEITADFSELGIKLDHLYNELWIEQKLLDLEDLKGAVSGMLTSTYAKYQRPIPADGLDRAMRSISTDKGVSFGRLNETMQKGAILKIISSNDALDWVRNQANLGVLDETKIKANQSAVAENFSLSAYGSKVYRIYEDILGAHQEDATFADGSLMLDQFLCPERINLLRD